LKASGSLIPVKKEHDDDDRPHVARANSTVHDAWDGELPATQPGNIEPLQVQQPDQLAHPASVERTTVSKPSTTVLTKAKKQLGRMMRPRADGSYIVPDDVRAQWNQSKNEQDQLIKIYHATGMDKVRFQTT
jgi:hypothetical protein